MSTETQIRKWHNVNIKGNWELHYKVTNSRGPDAFGMQHIPSYASPYDQQKVYLKGVNGEAKNGFIMDNIVVSFNPDKFVDHYNKISFLICHPWINIVGVPGLDEEVLKAKTGSKFTLICKDYAEIDKIEREDFIDMIKGRLSLDKGSQAVGLTRLRYLLAYCNLSYTDPRFEDDKEQEKKVLRSRLKKHVSKNYESAEQVAAALENEAQAKNMFEFKEMIKHHILKYDGILYKYNNVPVGKSFEETEVFFGNNPEVRTAILQKLYKIIKD